MTNKSYKKKLLFIILSLLLLHQISSQTITVLHPKKLVDSIATLSQHKNSTLKVHVSPLGFKPLSGQLSITIKSSDPLDACSAVKSASPDFPIFLLVNDQKCLESVKAKNIAKSGAHGMIVLKNSNITLNDKEIDIAHIPILELQKQTFNIIQDFSSKAQVGSQQISAVVNFNRQTGLNENIIQVQVYLSPTEAVSYDFLIKIRQFFQGQPLSFVPHYVFHSQRQSQGQKNYKGCYSSGRYCAPELSFEGKMQGESVVSESLRQLIIWKKFGGPAGKYWKYIEGWLKVCLISKSAQIFMNSNETKICSQKVMFDFDIQPNFVESQVKNSFENNGQPRVDDNIYLLEERQAYINEKITKHPVVLINKVEYPLEIDTVKKRICQLQLHKGSEGQGGMSSKCKQYFNKSSGLTVPEILIGTVVMGAIMAITMCTYKWYIERKMKNQMKGEVSKTLEQYYKYMEAYEKGDAPSSLREELYPNQPGASEHGYKKETVMREQQQRQRENTVNSKQVQMSEISKKTKNVQGKHETLNEQKDEDSSSYSGSDEGNDKL